jgi:hypothetical protein
MQITICWLLCSLIIIGTGKKNSFIKFYYAAITSNYVYSRAGARITPNVPNRWDALLPGWFALFSGVSNVALAHLAQLLHPHPCPETSNPRIVSLIMPRGQQSVTTMHTFGNCGV